MRALHLVGLALALDALMSATVGLALNAARPWIRGAGILAAAVLGVAIVALVRHFRRREDS
jgi:hypothetical protein